MKRNYSIIKIDSISEISRDIGQVFFAVMFIEQTLNKDASWGTALTGLLLSIGFWILGLSLTEK